LQGVASLANAQPHQLSFLHNVKYRSLLQSTQAGAVLLGEGVEYSGNHIVCRDPHRAYARAMQLFYPQYWPKPSVSSQAYISPTAKLGDDVHIEAFAWIGDEVTIGAGSWIQSGVRIGAGAEIGDNCKVMANAVIHERCIVGRGVWINSGAVIGGEGFGFAVGPGGITKIPQVGLVVIEDDVEIGCNTCVDRATLDETRVGFSSKLDNLVQVGHGASVGEQSLLVAYAAIAGSAKVGKRVILAGRASVLGHTHLGDNSRVGVLGVINRNQQGEFSGFPAIAHQKWLRAANAFKDIPSILKRLRSLERRQSD